MGCRLPGEIFCFRSDQNTVFDIQKTSVMASIHLEGASFFFGFKHLQKTVNGDAFDCAAGG